LESRLRATMDSLGWTLYMLTARRRVTPSGLSIFALRASSHRTSGKDCGGWLTPTANDDASGNPGSKMQVMLPAQAKLTGWSTTSTRDWRDGPIDLPPRPDGKSRLDQLPRQANLAGWPTPTAQDPSRGGLPPRPQDIGIPLSQMAAISGWPTPTAADQKWRTSSGEASDRRIASGKQMTLEAMVHQVGPVRITASGEILTGSGAGMESGGVLNPGHSRWLMGYPPEWCDCAVTATQSFPKSQPRSSKQQV
jgi:hypothetical protein